MKLLEFLRLIDFLIFNYFVTYKRLSTKLRKNSTIFLMNFNYVIFIHTILLYMGTRFTHYKKMTIIIRTHKSVIYF